MLIFFISNFTQIFTCMSSSKIYAVSLGPGDPELVTIKALKYLNKCSVIFYPQTVGSSGDIKSHSGSILNCLDIDKSKMQGYTVPMKVDRDDALAAYRDVAIQASDLCKKGSDICIVAEGDISFYSTFSYMTDVFNDDNTDYEVVPGIPAFINAGAVGQIPISLQQDKTLIITGFSSDTEIEESVSNNHTVVVMKPARKKNQICDIIDKLDKSFIYAEGVGTDREFITNSTDVVREREKTYFSIFIINNYPQK